MVKLSISIININKYILKQKIKYNLKLKNIDDFRIKFVAMTCNSKTLHMVIFQFF